MPVCLPPDLEAAQVVQDTQASETEALHGAVRHIKNRVIGCGARKREYIDGGILPNLISILAWKSGTVSVEASYICNSLAHGGACYGKALVDHGIVPVLIQGIFSENVELVEANLRTLKTIHRYPDIVSDCIWDYKNAITHLIQLMSLSETCGQSCATILASVCKTKEHQMILATTDIIKNLEELLESEYPQTHIAALYCLSELSSDNQFVCQEMLLQSHAGLRSKIFDKMTFEHDELVQYEAAKCLTNVYKSRAIEVMPQSSYMEDDAFFVRRILNTIVNLCLGDNIELKHSGAKLLHKFILEIPELQLLASYSQKLIQGLSKYFTTSPRNKGEHAALRAAAFIAFSALSQSREEIRRIIIEGENIIPHLKQGLQDECLEVQVAALHCLHSLSRSVKQLRTSLLDAAVWQPLLNLVRSDDLSLVRTASNTLCNLLLEFSPSKDLILEEEGIVEKLSELALHSDDDLRLNGVWALMNMAYNAETTLREKILHHFGVPMMLSRIKDSNDKIRIKTLGLLRNILKEPEEIDSLVEVHYTELQSTLIPILARDTEADEQEQVLCVFVNVATGKSAVDRLMQCPEFLTLLLQFLSHANTLIQIAAIMCVTHMARGSTERQAKLRSLGYFKQLQGMLCATTEVSDRVKHCLNYFQ